MNQVSVLFSQKHHCVKALLCWVLCVICVLMSTLSIAGKPSKLVTHVLRHSDDPMTGTDVGYEETLLTLALEYTKEQYGPYSVAPVKTYKLTQERAKVDMSIDRHPNFVRTFGYEDNLLSEFNLDLIPFPTRLGMFGYRVCFTSQEAAVPFSKVKTANDLKGFDFGVGIGWLDEKILQQNGLKTTAIPTLEGMFKMADLGRIDLVCRGAPEIQPEYYGFKQLESLGYDKNIVIYYPLPLFFYTHKSNALLKERIQKGLMIAHKKGDIAKAWQAHKGEAVAFVELHKRKMIELNNPFLKNVDKQYEAFVYRPK